MTYPRIARVTAAFILVTITSGCCLFREPIPEGEPPKGPIVSQVKTQKSFTAKRAINRVVTSVSMQVNMKYGGVKPLMAVKHNGEEKSHSLGQSAFYKLLAVGSITPFFEDKDKAPELLLLNTYTQENGILTWDVKLLKAGSPQPIWKTTLAIKADETRKKPAVVAPVVVQ